MKELDLTVEVSRQGGTAFHPVAAIVIGNAADTPNTRAMNVSADHRFDGMTFGITNNRRFEFADEINRVLDPLLRVSTERPITEAESPSHKVDQRIEAEEELVAK